MCNMSQIVLERVMAWRWSRQREALVWNSGSGALNSPAGYGDSRAHLPWAPRVLPPAPRGPNSGLARPLPPPGLTAGQAGPEPHAPPTHAHTYTALVYAQAAGPPLNKLLINLAHTSHCERVSLHI